MVFPLGDVSGIMKFTGFLWIAISVILVLIVLMQKGRGGGLSSAFGGAGGGGLLGSKTGDFLTWVTIALVILWLLLSVVLAKWFKPSGESDLLKSPPAAVSEPVRQPEPAFDEFVAAEVKDANNK